jgi:hypothetical protein
MSIKTTFISIFIVAIFGSLLWYLNISTSEDLAQNSLQSSVSVSTDSADIPVPPYSIVNTRKETNAESVVEKYALLMRETFASSIQLLKVQVGLKSFRDELESDYPGQGASLFEQVVRRAFPDLATEILTSVGKMQTYDEWLVANYLDLNDKDPLSKEGAIWAKRNEIFTEEGAREIWSEELTQAQEREETMHKVLATLNTADDMPMEDRVYIMQSAMQEQYGSTPQGLALGTTGLATQLVFDLESVQKELRGMSEDDRQESINAVRRQMGYPEDRIEALEKMDRDNEARWQRGYGYMEERTEIIAQYEGDALTEKLDELRVKHFDERTAYSIKVEEEQMKFLRFDEPRIFGRN